MAVLAKSGLPGIIHKYKESDHIPCQLAASAIAAGDICALGSSGWAPAAVPGKGLFMAGNSANAGEGVTLFRAGCRFRYADPAGGITPGTLFYLDHTTPGALNSTISNFAAIADPTAPVVVSAVAGGAIPNGVYQVGYVNRNANGTTKLTTTLAAYTSASTNQTLHVAALAFPTGVTSRDIYMETTPGSGVLAFVANDATAGAFGVTAVPAEGAPQVPQANTTALVDTAPLAIALANANGVYEGVIELL